MGSLNRNWLLKDTPHAQIQPWWMALEPYSCVCRLWSSWSALSVGRGRNLQREPLPSLLSSFPGWERCLWWVGVWEEGEAGGSNLVKVGVSKWEGSLVSWRMWTTKSSNTYTKQNLWLLAYREQFRLFLFGREDKGGGETRKGLSVWHLAILKSRSVNCTPHVGFAWTNMFIPGV